MTGCTVYAVDDALVVVSQGVTEMGLGASIEPFFKVSASASAESIGAIVFMALRSEKTPIPEPHWKAVHSTLLRFVGQKSWISFARSAKMYVIATQGDRVVVTPTHSEKGAFLHVPDRARDCPADDSAIGQLVLEMLGELRLDWPEALKIGLSAFVVTLLIYFINAGAGAIRVARPFPRPIPAPA